MVFCPLSLNCPIWPPIPVSSWSWKPRGLWTLLGLDFSSPGLGRKERFLVLRGWRGVRGYGERQSSVVCPCRPLRHRQVSHKLHCSSISITLVCCWRFYIFQGFCGEGTTLRPEVEMAQVSRSWGLWQELIHPEWSSGAENQHPHPRKLAVSLSAGCHFGVHVYSGPSQSSWQKSHSRTCIWVFGQFEKDLTFTRKKQSSSVPAAGISLFPVFIEKEKKKDHFSNFCRRKYYSPLVGQNFEISKERYLPELAG